MAWLFETGRVVDLIVGMTLLEGVAVAAYHRATGRGVAAFDLACNLLAGIALLLALRAALVEAWWGWVALCLAAALVAHLVDLRRRWG